MSGRAVDLPVEDRATAPGAAARNAAVLRPVDRIGRVDRVDPVGLGAAADPEVAPTEVLIKDPVKAPAT